MIMTRNPHFTRYGDPNDLPWTAPGVLEENVCFHCHRTVSDPAIDWHGSGASGEAVVLAFHPACAVEFMLRLGRDVHEIEVFTGGALVADLAKSSPGPS